MSEASSEVVWYLARDSQQHGPLSDAEMRLFVKGGHLRDGDLVWRPGFQDWKPARSVFPEEPAAQKPAPPPPPQPASQPLDQQSGPAAERATEPVSQPADRTTRETRASDIKRADPSPVSDIDADTEPLVPAKTPTGTSPLGADEARPSFAGAADADDEKTLPEPATDWPGDGARGSASPQAQGGTSAGDIAPQSETTSAQQKPSAQSVQPTQPGFANPGTSDGTAGAPQLFGRARQFESPGQGSGMASHPGAGPGAGSPRSGGPVAHPAGQRHAPSWATGPAAAGGPAGASGPEHRGGPGLQGPGARAIAGGQAEPSFSADARIGAVSGQSDPTQTRARLADDDFGPAPGHGDYDDDDDGASGQPRSGGLGRLAAVGLALAVIGGGGYFAYENRDTLADFMESAAVATSTGSGGEPPLVRAPEVGARTAALDPETRPPQPVAATPEAQPEEPPTRQPSSAGPAVPGIVVLSPSVPPAIPAQPAAQTAALDSSTGDSPDGTGNGEQATTEVIDANFQRSPLWSLLKREFPDWYEARVREVAQKSSGNEATDVSKYLINELVALRRKHAKEALAASSDKLRGVAEAFLANLRNLSTHSTETCFEFISKGESSPAVIELFPSEAYGNTIEAQIAAVFEAVAEGRRAPAERQSAQKPDYDVLAKHLGEIGWKQDDLKLFANPKALAEAPRERVCQMVQDWFRAHIGIDDKSVQERLLYVTLRPVIAG